MAASGVMTGIVGWYVAGHQILIAYPPLDAVPQVSALALLGTAIGLAGGLCAPPAAVPFHRIPQEVTA